MAGLGLERLAERHRDGLRAACAADPHIWAINPYSMLVAAFDAWWDGAARAERWYFASIAEAAVLGLPSYRIDAANAVVEIGGPVPVAAPS